MIHDALDGLMGVLDAGWTALFLPHSPNSQQGSLFTLHQARFMIQPDYVFPREGFWQGFWQTEQAQLQDLFGPVPEIEQIFPQTRAMLTQTLSLANRAQGLLIACSEEIRAFSGFRQLFNIFGTHIASALQNARLHAQINELAIRDGLTGLFNRHQLEERMRYSYDVSRRYGRELSVLMVDIDHFKTFNDTYGHQVGDLVLREVATVLKQRLRSTDIIGRYGGEEFMAILQETGEIGAEIVSQDLVRMVEALEIDAGLDKALKVTISAGYAYFPGDAASIENLIKIADLGLYQAKRAGRNQVGYAGQTKSVLQ
jgi:diguanylate cyclase (GGDEF)-like protein